MCLVGFRWDPASDEPLLLLANRDESFARPTAALHVWPRDSQEYPSILAGKDLLKGGTWLGITESGRFAAVTNVRDALARRDGRSRGELTRAFLEGTTSPRAYADDVAAHAHEIASFNLFVGDREEIFYVADHFETGAAHGEARALQPGVHVVSNGRLGDAWPKVRRLEELLRTAAPGTPDAVLFRAMLDRTGAPDAELPSTGVPHEIERLLAPPFIAQPDYGTRASTLVRFSRHGAHIVERTFSPGGQEAGERVLATASD